MARYHLLDKLGEGGMGVVFRARQTDLDRLVALKILRSTTGDLQDKSDRFRREARAMSLLSHPHCIRVLDFGEMEDGQLYLAMDLLSGTDLERFSGQSGAMDPGRAATLLGQAADALSYLHRQGVLHRDIKPANMMVDVQDHLTLMDFGLAKVTDQENLTRTGTVLGTPRFMAPELFNGEAPSAASDVYGLGLSFWEVLTGERAYQGKSVPESIVQILAGPPKSAAIVRDSVHPWLSELVDRAVAPNPKMRPTPDEVRDRVHRELRTSSTRGRPTISKAGRLPTLAKPLPPRFSDSPSRIGRKLGAGLVTVVFIGLCLASLRTSSPAPTAAGAHPRASSRTPPSPSRSGARAGASSSAQDLSIIADRFLAATAQVEPAGMIDKLHADLRRIGTGKWFRVPPHPAMVDLTKRWTVRLGKAIAASRVAARLDDLVDLNGSQWAPGGLSPGRRLDVYLSLHALADLVLYGRRFGIELPLEPSRALPSWWGLTPLKPRMSPQGPQHYGQTVRQRFTASGGVCLCFELTGDHQAIATTAARPHEPGVKAIPVKASERFRQLADARSSDLSGTLADVGFAQLEYSHPDPLPIPPLSTLKALELQVTISDLHSNASFRVDLSTDGRVFQESAVIRGEMDSQHRTWWHILDRPAGRGDRLWIRVRMRLLPDMIAISEQACLAHLAVLYAGQIRP